MRFNTTPTVANHNGGTSSILSPKQELIKACLTSFLSRDFYESDKEKLARIVEYVSKVPPLFALQLAVFSREYGLRTVNHVVFAEACKRLYGKKGCRATISKYLDLMVRRPDELMEIVGYHCQSSGYDFKSAVLPNALKHAISDRLAKFGDYQLAKYRGKASEINLFDLVNMTHPKSEPIGKLMNGNLESADTWEVEISKNGNNAESWLRLLTEKKLGALATVRNLKNMIVAGVNPDTVADYLDGIKWADVFPFQAIQALDVLSRETGVPARVSETVQKHVRECFKFISSRYPGKVAIGVDVSGSMYTSVTGLSKINRQGMAISYGQILRELTDGDLYFWANTCIEIKTEDFNELMRISCMLGGGTEVSCLTSKVKGMGYDHLIVLTDEQTSGTYFENVAGETVVWGLHDYSNTITVLPKFTYFTGYNDIMWKIGADMKNLSALEKTISEI